MNTLDNAHVVPAALYARKSADEDLSPSSDTGNQTREIREWAAKNGFIIVEEFIDEGIRAWTMDRPGINAIKVAIREKPRRFEALIVSAWDRLSRDIGDAFLLTGELDAYGIRLISVLQGEASDGNSKLGRDLYFLLAKLENSARAGHVLAGQKRWAAEGYSPGGEPPYGYKRKYVEDSKGVMRVKYVIDPEKARVVRMIFEWRAERMSMTAIKDRLNAQSIPAPRGGEWKEQTVKRVLRGSKYTGAMVFNRERINKRFRHRTPKPNEEWVICDGAHEAIVSPELAETSRNIKIAR